MLFTFGLLLAIIPALTGLGFGTISLFRFFNLKSPYRFDFMEPVVGLAVLGVLVNVENFFSPVSRAFALGVLLLGWVLFVMRVRRIAALLFKPLWIGLCVVWVGIVSTQAVFAPANYDSGLYHIPTIRWLVDSAVPFGLANLHGRLGFNSEWFSVSAGLAQIVAPFASRYTALASEALFAVLGIAIIGALYKFVHGKTDDLPTVFLLLVGLVSFAPVVLGNLSSPSADHAVLLFALLLVYVFLRGINARTPSAFLYEFWLSVLFAVTAVTFKVSVLPLLLIPVALLVIGYRRRLGLEHWQNLMPALVTTVVVLGTWMVRGVILSGCLAYPSSITCFSGLPWALPRLMVETEAIWIMSWARDAGNLDAAYVLGHWDWLGLWFGDLLSSGDYILPLIFLGIGFIACLLLWRQVYSRSEFLPVLFLVGISLAGMIYWFVSAPNLRFGSTWFWIPALLVLGLAAVALGSIPDGRTVVGVALVLVLFASGAYVTSVAVTEVRRTGIGFRNAAVMQPPLPGAVLAVQMTNQGVPINTVVGGDRCYWAPNCTADFNPAIVFERAADNRLMILPR